MLRYIPSKVNDKFIAHCLTMIAIGFVTTGCGDNARVQAVEASIQNMKQSAQKTVRPVPEVNLQFPAATQYGSNSEAVKIEKLKTAGANAVAGVPVNPMQAYPVNKYQFVGVVDEQDHLSAYLLAPDGQIYQVNEGDVIGDNYGKISKIDTDHLTVVETGKDQNNKVAQQSITLELKEDKDEQS